jgi:hypothetical protein
MFLQKSFDIIVSSNPDLGAVGISADGSTFSVQLSSGGLGIPSDAKEVSISVLNADLWYNTSNVITGVNDKFYFTISRISGGIGSYVVPIPQGLYSINDIQTIIYREAERLYPTDVGVLDLVTNDRIKIAPDNASGKVLITFAVAGGNTFDLACDFTSPDNLGGLLGFTTDIIATTTEYYFYSNTVPEFNSFNYYLIQSDITDLGMLINGQYNQILTKVLISAKPQTQLIYSPNVPNIIDANSLVNNSRRNYRFSLLSDSLKPINTNGEYWSAQLRISFYQQASFG